MGFSTAMESGLAAVGEAGAKLGAASFLAQQQAEIEALRDARISEIRLKEEDVIAGRKVERDATERARVETEAQRMADTDSAGLINSARSQYQNADMSDADKATGLAAVDAAESGGAYNREPTNIERLQAKGDYAGAEQIKNLESDNSRLDRTFAAETEHRAKTLDETIRHNKQVEANQPEKISAAARAQLEMASTYVMSAHKAEAEAAKALEAGRKDTLASPEKITQLEKDYKTSKAVVESALKQYDSIGAAHFGNDWKKIEAPTPADTGGKLVYGADGKLVRDKPAAPAAGDKPAAPAAGGNEIQKIDAEIATIRTSLNTDKTRRTNPLKGGGEILSADEVSRLEARLSELKTRRQKIGGSPIMDAASSIMNAVRN